MTAGPDTGSDATLRALQSLIATATQPLDKLRNILLAALLGLGDGEEDGSTDLQRLLARAQVLREVLACSAVALIGLALTGRLSGALWGFVASALAGSVLPRLLVWPLRYVEWLRELQFHPEPGWLIHLRERIGPRGWPWLGIALLVLGCALLQPALHWFPAMSTGVYSMALGLLLIGAALALPPSMPQALTALALIAYTLAALRPAPGWVLGLGVAWVLGVIQRWHLEQNVSRLPWALRLTVGLPAHVADVASQGGRAGHRLVIAGLLLAWSPHLFLYLTPAPAADWLLALAGVSLVAWLQGRATRLGRRWFLHLGKT